MTSPDRPRRSSGPRPEHLSPPPSSSIGGSAIRLSPATFVDLSANQEHHAIEALAELLVPLLTDPHRAPIGPGTELTTEPIVATRVAPIGDP